MPLVLFYSPRLLLCCLLGATLTFSNTFIPASLQSLFIVVSPVTEVAGLIVAALVYLDSAKEMSPELPGPANYPIQYEPLHIVDPQDQVLQDYNPNAAE